MSTDLYGDVDPEIENRRTTYYNERFWQLNSLVISGSEKTWNYLLTVNGGGCVAILTLIGAISDYRKLSWPYWVLALFVLGLSLVGVFHAFWAHKTNSLLEGWKADSWSYWQRNITWDENTKRDKGRVNSWSTFPWLLGWCSFACFLIAVFLAAYNLNNLI